MIDADTIVMLCGISFIMGCGFSLMALGAAYRNGICDGYGFSREPHNPGYQTAGDWLKANMTYRWSELGDEL